MSEMSDCPQLGPCPDDFTFTNPHGCLLAWSLPGVIRRGGRYSVSATLNRKFPEDNPDPLRCQGIVSLPGVDPNGRVWHNGMASGDRVFLDASTASHSITVETDPRPDVTCPDWEQAMIRSDAGYAVGRCVLVLPNIPLAPDEEDRATKDIPCPVKELLERLGFTGINGCAILQQLIDMLLSNPLSLGGFGGVLMSYLSDLFEFPPGSMGWGWQMNLYQRIEERESGRDKPDLVYHDGTGSFERWEWRDGAYVPAHRNNYIQLETNPSPADDPDEESPDARWYYRLVFQDQTALEFDYPIYRGRLLRRVDPHIEDIDAGRVTFHYNEGYDGRLDTIRDGFGRALRVSHDPQNNDGQPSSIQVRYSETDWKVVRFEYDANRRLSAIVGPYTGPGEPPADVESTRFTYHEDPDAGAEFGRLKEVKGPTETVLVRFDYYRDGLNQGKVRTERLHVPASNPGDEKVGQRRNTYDYDTELRRVTITVEDFGDYEPRNASRTYLVDYDERFNVIRTQDPLGNVVSYEYGDPRDPYLVTRVVNLGVTEPQPKSTAITYNSQGLVTSTEDPAGTVTRMEYHGLEIPNQNPLHRNQLGRLYRPGKVTVFREGQRGTADYEPLVFHHDPLGNLERVVQRVLDVSSGQFQELETVLAWNERGLVKAITDRDGHTTSFLYHPANGNLESITTPGTPKALPFEALGPLTTTLLYEHPTRFDRVTGVRYPWGTPWRFEHDEHERLTRAIDRTSGFHTSFVYEKGRLKEVLSPPNRYSASDDTPAKGPDVQRKTRYEYDAASRLEKVFSDVRPEVEQLRVRFRHDGFGHLREMVRRLQVDGVALDQVTKYQYDRLSRLVQTTDPRSKSSLVIPSPYCNENRYVSAAGRETTVTMDRLCRLASVSHKTDGDTTFEHDELHRLIRVQQPGGTPAKYGSGLYRVSRYSDVGAEQEARTFEYDALDRLVRVNFPDGKFIRYGYNPGGRLTSVTDVHGRETHYTYYHDGRLREVTFGEATFQYHYDATGRLERLVYPPSTDLVAHYRWTGRGELEELDYRRGSSSVHRLRYQYDAAGNRVSLVDSLDDGRRTTSWDYWYDGLNRLEWVCRDGLPVHRYRFDQSDNRSELQVFENGDLRETHVYHYELGDRLARVSRGPDDLFRFLYDDDGNTLEREDVGSRTDTYGWTDAGALKTIRTSVAGEEESVFANYYDAGRIRKRKLAADGTRTDYYYSGLPALSETVTLPSSPEELRSYVVGHQVLGYSDGESFRFFLPDALGSVRELVDVDGSVQSIYTYDEYGASSDSSRFGPFSLPAEASIRYLRIRWYDPTHGRFLSKDPLRFQHPYNYANENPINRTDPTGLAPGLDIPISNMSRYIPPAVQQTLTAEARFAMAKRFVELYNKRADFGAGYDQELAAVNAHPLIMGGPGYWNLWFNPFLWLQPRHESHVVQHRWTEVHPRNVCPERYGGKFDRVDIVNLGGLLVHEGWHYVYPDYKHVADLATDPMTLEFDSPMKDRLGKFAAGLSDDDWAYIEGR